MQIRRAHNIARKNQCVVQFASNLVFFVWQCVCQCVLFNHFPKSPHILQELNFFGALFTEVLCFGVLGVISQNLWITFLSGLLPLHLNTWFSIIESMISHNRNTCSKPMKLFLTNRTRYGQRVFFSKKRMRYVVSLILSIIIRMWAIIALEYSYVY